MSPDPIVFVVDDDQGQREALTFLFESVGLDTVAYRSAQEFLKQQVTDRPGVLVTDLIMDGMSGLALQQKLLELRSLLPVIIISGQGDIESAVTALRGGALDFIEKPINNEILLERVREAINKSVSAHKIQEGKAEARERLSDLTEREREVFDQLLLGRTSKMIAGALGISERTVEIHRARVIKKPVPGLLQG